MKRYRYLLVCFVLFIFVACEDSSFEVKTWEENNNVNNIEITAIKEDGAEVNEIIINGGNCKSTWTELHNAMFYNRLPYRPSIGQEIMVKDKNILEEYIETNKDILINGLINGMDTYNGMIYSGVNKEEADTISKNLNNIAIDYVFNNKFKNQQEFRKEADLVTNKILAQSLKWREYERHVYHIDDIVKRYKDVLDINSYDKEIMEKVEKYKADGVIFEEIIKKEDARRFIPSASSLPPIPYKIYKVKQLPELPKPPAYKLNYGKSIEDFAIKCRILKVEIVTPKGIETYKF